MKHTTLMCGIVLGLALLTWNARAGQSGVRFFEGTWSQALAEARKQNKPIYMDCYTTWCGPCKVLKEKVFPDEKVAAYLNANYIACSFDMEKGEGLKIAEQYGVQSYPTHLFFDSDGNLVHKGVGAGGNDSYKAEFITMAQNARDPEKQYYTLKKRYERGERSVDFLYNYAFAGLEAYAEDAKTIAKEYFATQNREDLFNERNWQAIRTLVTDFDFNEAYFLMNAKNKQQFEERYGVGPVNTKLLGMAVGSASRAKRQMSQAERVIESTRQAMTEAKTEEERNEMRGLYMRYYEIHEDWERYAEVAVDYAASVNDNGDELNAVAWTFYEHVTDPAMLDHARRWAARSIELGSGYANNDTYAAILYKLGRYDEAMKAAERAIELGKRENADYGSTEELLQQIRRKTADGGAIGQSGSGVAQ